MSQMLIISEIMKWYGKNAVLRDVTVPLEMGRIIGLTGANGVGKTTLLKILSGIIRPDDGEIRIGEYPHKEKPLSRQQLKSKFSFLGTPVYLSQYLNVRQQIEFTNDIYEDFDKDKALNLCHNLNIDLNSRNTTLSKGFQSMLLTVLALSRQTAVYLLDEPLDGLDVAAKKRIKEVIRSQSQENNLVIIATHLLADLDSLLDELLILKDGCVKELIGCDEIREETGSSIESYVEEVLS